MYEMVRYTSTNGVGTAVLLQALAQRRVQRLIVASSMSIYGEGVSGGVTRESWPANVTSVYGLSKYDQEQLCLIAGKAYGIPTTALRFFNVYGPRQALSNPYTGVIAIFASRLLNGKPPIIYEDGMQTRDFVSVHDVVNACALALVARAVGVFNVGTGRATTVLDVARMLRRVLGKLYIEPIVTGTRRAGDIRHCVADISQAREKLGYEPAIRLEDGLSDLADWLRDQVAVDNVERAARELELRGLTV
jgi:dTDP-L-rhamnose 4-epimerase